VAGEFGDSNCGHSFSDQFMNWMDGIGAGYLAWAWTVAPCSNPSVITDYSGTPTGFGQGVRSHFQGQTVSNINDSELTPPAREQFAQAVQVHQGAIVVAVQAASSRYNPGRAPNQSSPYAAALDGLPYFVAWKVLTRGRRRRRSLPSQ
jgi:hypothetical protein